jgi:transcriptional regulator with PAS, ATPase and Fis domain
MKKFLETDRILDEFLKSSNVGLGIVNHELRFQALNLRLAEMNGIPIKSHLGRTVREVLGDEVAVQVEPAIKQVLETGQPIFNFVLEGNLPGRQDATRLVDHLLPLRDANGNVKQVGAVVVEIRPNSKPVGGIHAHNEPLPDSRNEILRSWKDIANYVGACVKTAQRWEQQHGLPVRRLERSNGAVVFALKAEVDSWVQMRTRQAS